MRIRVGLRELRAVDRPPFAAAIRAGAGLVMLSSAIYPTLSHAPAVLSPRVVQGELRRGLGFKGVTISDDLEAPAFASRGGASGAALAATRAGVDLLLFARTYDGADRAARALADGAALGARGSRRARGFAGARARPARGVALALAPATASHLHGARRKR